MPSETAILAYAAGLFDGEGSISIALVRERSGERRLRHHRLMLKLASCDPELPEWMERHFGGHISSPSRVNLVGRARPATSWGTNSAHAEAFLRAILPYLVLKAPRAEIALRLRATRLPHAGNRRGARGGIRFPITDSVFAEREALRQQLKALNQRGRLPESDTTSRVDQEVTE